MASSSSSSAVEALSPSSGSRPPHSRASSARHPILRHRTFGSGRFDLGNMTQAVWSTAHGDFLSVTDVHGEQISRLGSHFDPILAALAPLWWVWPDPELLLVVQAIAVASGAIPVYWLARKHFDAEWPAAALAVAYLAYPPVQWLTMSDFHPVALACPLLLYAWWHLDETTPLGLRAAGRGGDRDEGARRPRRRRDGHLVRRPLPLAAHGSGDRRPGRRRRSRRDARRRAPLRAGRILRVREPLRLSLARRTRSHLSRLAARSRSRSCRSPHPSRCSRPCPSSGSTCSPRRSPRPR